MTSEIQAIHEKLQSGKLSCATLVQEKLNALAPNTHHTVNELLTTDALRKAAKVDEKIKTGQPIGLLEGIPFGVKDVYLLAGSKATASSDMLRNYQSPYTATAIQRLIEAGAIPIVKENGDCFGHGSSSENTVFGAVKNALNPALVAGGSSGGSAVNVALGHTVFSIGSDTGGSVRQPAGYNGIYGLKPTYGRISRYGLMAYASSTDCVGAFARTPEDIRIVLNAMSGKDYHDQTTVPSEPIPPSVFDNTDATQFVVGYYKSFIESDAIDAGIKTDFLKVIDTLKAHGVTVKELDFFDTHTLVSTYYVIAMAETASNLARLDGTNYGVRAQADSLKESYAITRSQNFTEETKRRIIGGNQVLSHGYSEAIYLKANALRGQIKHSFAQDFKTVNIILSPVSPMPTPAIGNVMSNPLAMYLSDAYTVGFSLGGVPTLTVPFGTTTGLQVTADKYKEHQILTFVNILKKIIFYENR